MVLKKKYKKHKRYFIVSSDKLSVIEPSFFENIDTWNKALVVAVSCYAQMHKVLIDDSLDGKDSYIGNMKVTTGLQRSLDELNERYPNIIDHIHSCPLFLNGARVIRC